MATILGLESTCDETAAAVVRDGREVLSNVVATQFKLHEKFRGVVPEIASRAHIENLLPTIQEALSQAACGLADLDAISVTHRPGLIGSLLIGVTAAKTLAWTLNKPLLAVDHVHAHLYSVMLQPKEEGRRMKDEQVPSQARDAGVPPAPPPSSFILHPSSLPPFPAVGLVVSGGHTALYEVRSFADISLIGSTIDDAIGEAYDKVAAILNLPYPGGPPIDRLAATGNPAAVPLPRSLLDKTSLDFSFSGLKTAVLYHVRGVPRKKRRDAEVGNREVGKKDQPPSPFPTSPPPLSPQALADLCASFQRACTDTVLEKLRRALRQTQGKSVIVGGGVSANRGLRTALSSLPVPVLFPPLQYCTDNAAMSAGLAHLAYARHDFAPLSLDALTHSQFRD